MHLKDYCSVNVAWVEWGTCGKGYIALSELQERRSFRAARLVDNSERFLLLNFPRSSRGTILYQYLSEIVQDGVLIGTERFSFFGVTEPGIKEGWVIFFREDHKLSVRRVLDLCGNLDKVFLDNGPGKYAARLGLSFSSTQATINISEDQALMIRDCRASDGTLTTDGSKPGQYKIAFRPSMHKYDGGSTVVDVNNISSTPICAKMNHAFIVILLTLGVKLKPIQDLLQRQIDEIEDLGRDRQRALAEFSSNPDAQGTWFFQELFDMLEAGHDMTEPYLESMIRRQQDSQYSSLLKKLNISVPKARYVYGVVDELDVLKQNEVNPSYLPSDLRVLKAAKYPELVFLRDCIVFPRDGKTSIPNLMAGGDLDGDKYFVCWDQTLIPPAVQEPEPTTTQQPSARSSSEVTRTISDLPNALVKLFARLHDSGLLGTASNEWKRAVERSQLLANAEYPKELASIVAVALDLTKTGADYSQLKRRFEDLKEKYYDTVQADFPSPLDPLRDQIPKPCKNMQRPLYYPIDPVLKIREGCEEAWDGFYREGQRQIGIFNSRLRDAIQSEKDRVLELGKLSGRSICAKKAGDSGADQVKEDFIKIYFEQSSDPMDRTNYLRASAWYCVGYERGKTAFAWLGSQYLNKLKAQNGCIPGMPGLSIDTSYETDGRNTPQQKDDELDMEGEEEVTVKENEIEIGIGIEENNEKEEEEPKTQGSGKPECKRSKKSIRRQKEKKEYDVLAMGDVQKSRPRWKILCLLFWLLILSLLSFCIPPEFENVATMLLIGNGSESHSESEAGIYEIALPFKLTL
ncbi:hypothetical protein EW145_g1192 [Phellinidium pouzarii]|uniref:RNA-dependent RNA polymerase n=1 Tax=Phellinidium pouzarii TaxID=167371 RepID=A0A4S4LFD6_9AGAM|nr:hypothetical protein EW145_g1192 [Phellinidium pouzarii]